MSKIRKKKNQPKARKAANTPQEKFNEALERYDRIKKKNASFRDDLDALIARVSSQIEPYELKKYDHLINLNFKLISFISKKTLPEYLREELRDWIHTNFEILQHNPFSHKLDLAPLFDAYDAEVTQLISNKNDKLFKKLEREGYDKEEIDELRDLAEKALRNELDGEDFDEEDLDDDEFEEMFREAMRESGFDGDFDEIDEDPMDDMFGFDNIFGEQPEPEFMREEPNKIETLFKKSAINKLFRRIARKLHPDLEQDDEEKKAKHKQMTELIEARNNNDVAYILQSYVQIFGKLPEDFPEAEYDTLTTIIKALTEKLKEEKDSILFENPMRGAFHDMFAAKTPHGEKKNIQEHITMLKNQTNNVISATEKITSIPKLRSFLEERMEQRYF